MTNNDGQHLKLASLDVKPTDIIYSEILSVNSISEIHEDWSKLESLGGNSYFLSWTWISSWAEICSKQTQLYLFKTFHNNALIGICFLTIADIRRHWNLVSSKQVQINEYKNKDFDLVNQYNNILCVRKYEVICWQQLFEQLRLWSNNWDELFVSSLPERMFNKLDTISTEYSPIVHKRHCTWYGELNDNSTSIKRILSTFKPKSRQQLRQSLKAVTKAFGEIKISQAKNIETASSYFNNMKELHTNKWKKQGKQGAFSEPNWVAMHDKIIEKGVESGDVMLLKIYTVKPSAGEMTQVLGYLYGHVYNKKVYMQQSGFMPSCDNRLRPGYVSHLHAMVFCSNLGITEYDFLPSSEQSYKKFFYSSTSHVFWISWQRPIIKFYLENLAIQFVRWYRCKRVNIKSFFY